MTVNTSTSHVISLISLPLCTATVEVTAVRQTLPIVLCSLLGSLQQVWNLKEGDDASATDLDPAISIRLSLPKKRTGLNPRKAYPASGRAKQRLQQLHLSSKHIASSVFLPVIGFHDNFLHSRCGVLRLCRVCSVVIPPVCSLLRLWHGPV